MKIISHHCQYSGGNMYICGPDDGGKAVIIDPGAFDQELLGVLTLHRYEIAGVLITHPEPPMLHAIRTISKVYQIEMYAGTDHLGDMSCTRIQEEQAIRIAGLEFQAIPMQAHSRESIIYHFQEVFFTGSIIHAGTLGDTPNAYAEALLVAMVKDAIAIYGEKSFILPGIGPATTFRAEFNLSPHYRTGQEEVIY